MHNRRPLHLASTIGPVETGLLPALEAALFKLTNKKLPDGVLADAITRVQFTEDPLPDTLAKMAAWSHEIGFLKDQPKLDGLVDTALLNELRGLQGGTP